MILRGGAGEPYCSQQCYDDGGKHAMAIRLRGESGVCAVCQTPVKMGLASDGAAFPYDGRTLFVCGSANCRERATAFVNQKNVCCMCGRAL